MNAGLNMSASMAILAAMIAYPAHAQTSTATKAADAQSTTTNDSQTSTTSQAEPAREGEQEIVVTGSRVRSGFGAPTPVSVATADQLKAQSPGLLATGLAQLPVFKGSSLPTTSTQSPGRENGASFLNLRGLGREKTLVLLDGRRFVSSSTSGVPDISLIPQNLVKRVEIVTGGASAAYGSDAVAGVVNFILDTDLTGLRGSASAGISTYGDGGSQNVSLTGGTKFAGDAGHIIANLEYFNQAQIGIKTGRPTQDSYAGIAAIGGGVRAVVRDQRFAIPTGGRIQALATGSPLSSSIVNLQFLDGGAIAPYSFGTNFDGVRQVGGDGSPLPFAISANIKRYSGFLRAQYEFDNDLTVYAEGTAAQSTTIGGFQYPQVGILGFQYTIYSDNAFLRQLPAATQSRLGLPAAGGASTALFTLRRIPEDNGLVTYKTSSRTFRGVLGADWRLGGNFEINAYYMHGENKYRNDILQNPVQLRRYAAVDAVVNPANGQVVCRVTLTAPTLFPGCVPFNPFGPNPGNAAANAYINGSTDGTISRGDLTLKEDVASLAVRGSVFTLPAGPVSVAAGVEARREAAVQTDDPGTSRTLLATDADVLAVRSFPAQLLNTPGNFYHYQNSQPLRGKYNVKEAFAEVDVPLLKDKTLFNLLTVNGAIRIIHYSTTGSVTTWKVGGIYEPIAGLRLRGTRSRDIRSGNIAELYSALTPATGTVTYQGVLQPQFGRRYGNPNLSPEKADTTTAGIVLRPAFLPGFNAALDYYDIKVSGAIQQLSGQQTSDACASGSAIACAQFSRDATGQLVIQLPYLNLAEVKNRGYDFETSYVTRVGSGQVGFRLIASRLSVFDTIIPGAAPQKRAGDIGLTGTPKWSGNLSVTYDSEQFGLFVQERYIGKGKVDSTVPDALLIGNSVPRVFYTDVSMHVNVDPGRTNLELFGTVNNVFNKQPPIAPAVPLGNYRPTNASLYDTIGRYFTVGARFKI